jgi:hypothetical protein
MSKCFNNRETTDNPLCDADRFLLALSSRKPAANPLGIDGEDGKNGFLIRSGKRKFFA